jgi:hypothetical protein
MTAVVSAHRASVNGQAGGEERMNAARETLQESSRRSSRPVSPAALRLMLAAAIALILIGFGIHAGPSPAARGDEKPPQGQNALSRDPIVTGFQRILRGYDDRLIGLARQVLNDLDSRQSPMDRLVNLRIDASKAEAEYLNAKLGREVAEIAVKEYSEGIFVQDLATVEGELSHAKSEIDRARDRVATAKDRQEKIKEVADENTAYGRMINYDYSDRVTSAMLQEPKTQFALEVAETKKKVLVEYTKPKQIKELQSEVAKARSKELAKQAESELLKGQIESLQKTARTEPAPSDVEKRILGLIERAIPIDEQAHTKLDQLGRNVDSAQSLQKEVQDLTNELGAIIEEAESVKSADGVARLKPRVQQSARRLGVIETK